MARFGDGEVVAVHDGGPSDWFAMEAQRRQPSGRIGPIIWGTIAFVLVAALGVSFLLSRQALSDGKREAEDRAEQLTSTVLRAALTPETTASDITGASYRELVGRLQQEVLSDDRVLRVRIWKPNGDLIFSTDQRDEVAEVVRGEDVRILQAAADQTVSTVTEGPVPTADGLAGSEERLLETFVPLHLANELSTSGVVQIDHRYSVIEEEATRIWRPTQLGLLIALGASMILLGFTSVRGRRRVEEPAEPRRVAAPSAPAPGTTAAARKAEERAAAAEKAAREAERKLKEAERQLAIVEQRIEEADKVGTAVSASVAKRVEELELQVRAEEAERERLQAEAQRLQSQLTRKEAELEQAGAEVQRLLATLSRKEGELAAVRDGIQGVQAETERTRNVVSSAQARAEEAERRASEAEAAMAELRRIADGLEQRVTAAEERAAQAERRAADAERTAVQIEARARAAEAAVAQASPTAGPTAELADLESRLGSALAELEDARSELGSKDEELAAMAAEVGRVTSEMAARPSAAASDGSRVAELEARVRELEDQRRSDVSELQRAHEMLANTQAELTLATRKLKEAEARAAEAAIGAPPEPVPEGVQEPAPPRTTRRRGRREPVPEPEPSEPVGVEPEPAAERPAAAASAEPAPAGSVEEEPADLGEPELGEEGLSLRERLTRAAAARHRTLGKPDA
jgi:chaperonin cofactor prefoldin